MIGVRWAIPMLLAATLSAPGPPRYQPPVSAPVVDEFRPPDEPWLAGNRGLEYDTVPGTAVTAIGPGLVVFAGSVADGLHVTVLHPDGIRSSYSFLAAITVARGDRVRTGTVVGVAADLFHLGARQGGSYIDPAALFGTVVGPADVYLVPDRHHRVQVLAGVNRAVRVLTRW